MLLWVMHEELYALMRARLSTVPAQSLAESEPPNLWGAEEVTLGLPPGGGMGATDSIYGLGANSRRCAPTPLDRSAKPWSC